MRTPKTEHVVLRLTPEDKACLRAEAYRRAEAGQATRIDMSAVAREVLSAWRAGRTPPPKATAR